MNIKDKYIGLPMERTNCWQFIVDYYSNELGIKLNDYKGRLKGLGDKAKLADFLDWYLNHSGCMNRVENPIYPDLVVFTIRGLILHSGIFLEDGLMLHMRVYGSLIETYDMQDGFKAKINNSIYGFYRYSGKKESVVPSHSLLSKKYYGIK